MKKVLSLVAGLGMVALIVGTFFVSQNVFAVSIDVCHKTGPNWNYLDTPDQTAHDSHIAHGDFDYAGPTDVSENDKDAWCQANVPANIPPVANADVDQSITLPTSSVTLNGSLSSDSDGTIASYVWAFVSGPSTINPADTEDALVGGLLEGTYVFSLVVTDDDGATSNTDTVSVTVNPALPQCSDTINNDQDSFTDFPADPGCTDANDNTESPNPGNITIVKNTIGGNGTFHFNGLNGTGGFDLTTVAGTASRTFSALALGAYNVSEDSKTNWTPTSATCSDNSDPSQIDLDADENLTCTFTNTYVPPPTPPQCSDGVDNGDSEDTLADELDPGCWTDPNNSETYNPEDTDETTPTDVCPNDAGIQTNVEQCTPPPTPPQCSDTQSNDSDELIDANDPGCHTDGNVNNPESYDPNDNDETDVVEEDTSNRSSSGSRRSGSTPAGEVLGVESDALCAFDINTYMRKGYKNNLEQVKVLQWLLNKYSNPVPPLVIDGLFGPKTEVSVKSFQAKYRDEILKNAWGINAPTGIFFRSTLAKAKNLECPAETTSLPVGLTNAFNWSRSQGLVPPPVN